MQVVLKKISDLRNDPKNARKHSTKDQRAVMGSLRRFGQQKPIVIDSTGTVRCGNGVLMAAKKLEWTDIACVVSDLSDSDLLAYAIADNQTALLSDWDESQLDAALQEIDKDLKQLLQLEKEISELKEQEDLNVKFQILLTCDDEQHQKHLLDRFTKEGLRCRAMFT